MPFLIRPWAPPRDVPAFRIMPETPPGIERAARERFPACYPWDGDVEVPEDTFPTAARETRAFRQLPDLVTLKYWTAVSDDLRRVIEECEPGVHQFSPEIAITLTSGRPAGRAYHCINLRRYLNGTVLREHSNLRRMSNGAPDPRTIPEALILDEAAITGRHLWRAADFHLKWFMSEELAERMINARITGFDIQHHRAVARRAEAS